MRLSGMVNEILGLEYIGVTTLIQVANGDQASIWHIQIFSLENIGVTTLTFGSRNVIDYVTIRLAMRCFL